MVVDIGILAFFGVLFFIVYKFLFQTEKPLEKKYHEYEFSSNYHDMRPPICNSLDELVKFKKSAIEVTKGKLTEGDIKQFIRMWIDGKVHKNLKSLHITDRSRQLFKTEESLKNCGFNKNIFKIMPVRDGCDNDGRKMRCFKIRQEYSNKYMTVGMMRTQPFFCLDVYTVGSREEDSEDSDYY